jgi:hypothetical protein
MTDEELALYHKVYKFVIERLCGSKDEAKKLSLSMLKLVQDGKVVEMPDGQLVSTDKVPEHEREQARRLLSYLNNPHALRTRH